MVIITATGADRPGIVSAVTGVLLDLGGNLQDTAMSLLGGQFAMMLLVDVDASPRKVLHELDRATVHLGLHITVEPVQDGAPDRAGEPYVVSVYGADQRGIVHGIAQALASLNVNIRDLASHLVGDVYTMILDVDLPAGTEPAAVDAGLREAAGRLGVDYGFRAADADEL